jgi:adenylosuccinate synthase
VLKDTHPVFIFCEEKNKEFRSGRRQSFVISFSKVLFPEGLIRSLKVFKARDFSPVQKEVFMTNQINWIRDLKSGLDKAREEKKTVLLDFFNPG